MINDIVGYIAGTFMTVTMIPQIIKSIKTKSVKDISSLMLILLLMGSFLWMVYGILISSLPIIIMDILALVINFTQLSIKINYDKKK